MQQRLELHCSNDTAKGPHAPKLPRGWTILTRILELVILLVMASWVLWYLGGLGLKPQKTRNATHITGNDTSQIFNWHPLLNTLAFAVFLAEALLAFEAPVTASLDRGGQKIVHVTLHTCAVICTILALIAAVQSHTLKEPTPTPNFYSAHSWLGLLTFLLVIIQYVAGVVVFLMPKLPLRRRAEILPWHVFAGRAIFGLSLATIAVGIQEKATFVQLGAKLGARALRQNIMLLPALLLMLLALLAVLVLSHHAPLGPHTSQKPAESNELLEHSEPSSPNARL